MSGPAEPLQADPAAAYLQRLQTMADEVKTAIAAIAGNRLQELEESVARQEMLAATLVSSAKRAGEWMAAPGGGTLAEKIRSASVALQRLNMEYAALLRFASRPAAVLSALCRSCRGEFAEARGTRPSHRTWSCVI